MDQPALTPARMQELVDQHARLEYANDIDGLMATIADEPYWEFHPLGMRVEGRDAVRAVYLRQFEHTFNPDHPTIAGSKRRLTFFGERSFMQESEYRIRKDDGTEGESVAAICFEFEPDGRVISERVYASGAMIPTIEVWATPDLWALAGISRIDAADAEVR